MVRTDAGEEGTARLHRRARQRRAGRRRSRRCALSSGRRGRVVADLGGFSRRLTGDSQLRWLGPGEGRHPHGRRCGGQRRLGPAGRARGQAGVALLAELTPGAARRPGRLPLPARRADPGGGAGDPAARPSRAAAEREARLLARGYPAYTTTPGWLGYDDEKLRGCPRGGRGRLTTDQAEGGRRHRRRCPPASARPRRGRARRPHRRRRQPDLGRRARRSSGWRALAAFDPYWIEEPTSPRRHPRARRDPRGPSRRSGWPPGSTSQNRGRLQATAAGRGDRRRADRRLPGRRGQRERRDPAAGREVRRPGLPARRWGRAVRDGPAPGHVRLRGRRRQPRTG